MMFEIFSTREIASAIWIFIIIIFLAIKKDIRMAFFNVLKAVLNKHIIVPFIILLLYTIGISIIFNFLGIEIINFIKDIVLWFLFAGVPFAYSSINNKEIGLQYFKKYVIDNIKVIAILQFIISTFTFSIWIELLIFPVITFIVLLEAVSSKDNKYNRVEKFLSNILSILGFIILFFALQNAVTTYNNYGTINLLITFLIPFVLSIFYVPITYLFIMYAKYELLFCKIEFAINEKNKKRYKIILVKSFKLSFKKINYYLKNCIYKLYKNINDEDFLKLIKETELNYKN